MNTTNNIKIHAKIIISSSIIESANTITNTLKLTPSMTKDKGGFLGKKENENIYATETEWILKSTTPSHRPLQEHIQELLDIVEKNSKSFRALRKTCWLSIDCSYYSNRSHDISFLDPAIIKKLPGFPLNFGICIYYELLTQ